MLEMKADLLVQSADKVIILRSGLLSAAEESLSIVGSGSGKSTLLKNAAWGLPLGG